MTINLSADKTRLEGVPFEEAGSYGQKLGALKLLVMHFTAGRGFDSTVAYFKDPANKVSAHLVVGREGQLVQMVPFDKPAWHAGADSKWLSREPPWWMGSLTPLTHLNFHSLGIEFDNYGPLHQAADKRFYTWFGIEVSPDQAIEINPSANGSFGTRFWHAYTSVQIDLAQQLAAVLVRGFGLVDIVGHSDILPGKTDPGPLFPLSRIRSLVYGRADDEAGPVSSS